MQPVDTGALLRRRLLNDIRELQQKPYPGITLHTQHENALQNSCLILSPPGQDMLHLTIEFGDSYPLDPPTIKIQSDVSHPNVSTSSYAPLFSTRMRDTPLHTP